MRARRRGVILAPMPMPSSLTVRTTFRRLAAVAIGSATALTVAAPLAVAAGHRTPRSDLMISAGSVGVLHGRVNGSFLVTNAGNRKAPRSTATVTLRIRRQSRAVHSYGVRALRAGHKQTIRVSAALPASLATGSYRIIACADAAKVLKERSEANNCLTIGSVHGHRVAASRPAGRARPADRRTGASDHHPERTARLHPEHAAGRHREPGRQL